MNEEFSAFNENENDIGISTKKRSRIIIIAVILVIVIVAVSLIIILSSSNKNNEYEEKKKENFNYIIAKYNVTNVTGDLGNIRLYNKYLGKLPLISYLIIDGKKFQPNEIFQFNTTGIKEVIMYFNETLNRTSAFFAECEDLISVDLTNFDTSELKYMDLMFANSINLVSIIFGDNFSTKKVTEMDFLFCLCESLISLNLSMFDTSNVINFNSMFDECTSLK